MRWEDFRASDNVEDRRGMGLPGGAGGLGIGTMIILGLLGWVLGIDPRILIGGAEMVSRGSQTQRAPQGKQGVPEDQAGRFAAAVLGNTEDVWKEVLPSQVNRAYRPPKLVLFSGATRSGCGAAQSAMGPFYCPLDQTVYLDLSFFRRCSGASGRAGISPTPT
jgi:predicted metalloprotease